MRLSAKLLEWMGWHIDITVPDLDKCIICVAPHTSNWDFILGLLAYDSVGRHAGFLMKDTWFFFPLGYLFKAIGGIPVPRRKKGRSVVEVVVEKFNSAKRLQIAITPEGTRARTSKWHTGFLRISLQAHVPCLLGILDFATKTITINKVFHPTGDIDADMSYIKRFYSPYQGKYPNNFTTSEE